MQEILFDTAIDDQILNGNSGHFWPIFPHFWYSDANFASIFQKAHFNTFEIVICPKRLGGNTELK